MSISMGIDIGSTTAKVVITEDDQILFECYERHFSQVRPVSYTHLDVYKRQLQTL